MFVFVFAPSFARHYIVVALSPAPAHTKCWERWGSASCPSPVAGFATSGLEIVAHHATHAPKPLAPRTTDGRMGVCMRARGRASSSFTVTDESTARARGEKLVGVGRRRLYIRTSCLGYAYMP